jgi:hypothetical protein
MTVERRIGEAEHALKEMDQKVDELRGLTYETRYALFGFNGDNGLRSEVKALRAQLAQYRAEDEERRRQEVLDRRGERWKRWGTVAGLLGAILSPVITWALVTASGG